MRLPANTSVRNGDGVVSKCLMACLTRMLVER